MKVKVLKRFIDKETRKLNEVGSVIEVTKERFEEIMAAGGYVEAIEEIKAEVEEAEVETEIEEAEVEEEAEEELAQYEEMTVAELKAYAEEQEIDLGEATRKADIIEAIAKAEK